MSGRPRRKDRHTVRETGMRMRLTHDEKQCIKDAALLHGVKASVLARNGALSEAYQILNDYGPIARAKAVAKEEARLEDVEKKTKINIDFT